MYCGHCNAPLEENAAFCSKCGTPVAREAVQQPEIGYQPPQPDNTANPANALPMNWFKFLIYFLLWAGAVLNVISGFSMITGMQYGEEAGLVYAFFEGLQMLDVFIGICTIALAGLGIYTRFRLAGFYKNGPKMLTMTYACGIAISLIYLIGAASIVSAEVIDSSSIASLAGSAVMIAINTVYFKKRAALFTK